MPGDPPDRSTFRRRRLSVHRRRIAVAVVFATVVVVYLLQVPWILQFGEPYPALRMPGFETSAAGVSPITLRAVTIDVEFADGGTASPTRPELFAEMPESHHYLTLELNFGPPEEPTPHFRAYGLRRLLPGFAHRGPRPAEPPAQTRAWLANRLQALYPGRTATRACFHWHDDTYAGPGRLVFVAQQPRGDCCVKLTDER